MVSGEKTKKNAKRHAYSKPQKSHPIFKCTMGNANAKPKAEISLDDNG
jgi:hypothetical protein